MFLHPTKSKSWKLIFQTPLCGGGRLKSELSSTFGRGRQHQQIFSIFFLVVQHVEPEYLTAHKAYSYNHAYYVLLSHLQVISEVFL